MRHIQQVGKPRFTGVAKGPPSRSEATAYHEAGHAVVAFWLGLRVHSVTIVPDAVGGTVGVCRHSAGIGRSVDYDRSDRNRLRMERAVMCSLAGIEAQRKHRASSVRNYHAHSDYEKAVDLVSEFFPEADLAGLFIKFMVLRTNSAPARTTRRVALHQSPLTSSD